MALTKSPLYRLVRRHVGNDDDASDIIQESFIAAWNALHRYDRNRPLMAWLRAIALNKCRDHGRRQAVQGRLRKLFALEMLRRGEAPFPAEDEDAARLRHLDAAIAGLSAFYKEPLLLTTVSGLSHKEAAQQLGVSAKAVEMRVRRARRKLQDIVARSPE
jgi:RNA polymerase sigma-70 factor (ECF subfamily)